MTSVLDWSILGDPSELKMEFRCNRCWRSNYVTADQSGTETECLHCHTPVVVPEVTQERLQRALDHLTEELEEHASAEMQLGSAGKSVTADDAFAEQLHAAPLNPYEGFAQAGLFSRFVAWVIDSFTMSMMVLVGFVSLYYASRNGLASPIRPMTDMDLWQLTILCGPVLAFQSLQWLMLTVRGQTFGKFVCLIRIVTLSGCRAGFFRAVLVRDIGANVLRSVIPFFGLIDVLFIFGSTHRCLHDFMAGTKVVSTY